MMESYQAEDDNPFVKIFENSHVTQEDHLQVDISTFPPDSRNEEKYKHKILGNLIFFISKIFSAYNC